MKKSVKAYGKILICGAYSILEPGNIGIVCNVNRGTKVTCEETKEGKYILNLKDFDIEIHGVRSEHKILFFKEPKIIKHIKFAAECTLKYLMHKEVKVKEFRLISENDPELYVDRNTKLGFGTSATVTVATVASILALHGIDNPELVYKISKYSHYVSQGNIGSGFDISAACFGSQVYISRQEDYSDLLDFVKQTRTNHEPFLWPANIIPLLVFTGESASTTKLVKKVMDFKKRNRGEYDALIKDYNDINMECRKYFHSIDIDNIVECLEVSWDFRKKLGEHAGARIQTKEHDQLIDSLKGKGALTAGLLGAGGGDIMLCVCKNKEDKQDIINYCEDNNIVVLDEVDVINKGYEFV